MNSFSHLVASWLVSRVPPPAAQWVGTQAYRYIIYTHNKQCDSMPSLSDRSTCSLHSNNEQVQPIQQKGQCAEFFFFFCRCSILVSWHSCQNRILSGFYFEIDPTGSCVSTITVNLRLRVLTQHVLKLVSGRGISLEFDSDTWQPTLSALSSAPVKLSSRSLR